MADNAASTRGLSEEMEESHWELSVLIGPCTEREATDLMLELDDVTKQRYGSVWAASKVEDE